MSATRLPRMTIRAGVTAVYTRGRARSFRYRSWPLHDSCADVTTSSQTSQNCDQRGSHIEC
jgi:hypothetical protein